MSDFVPGTHVRMRVMRRFSHYNIGDLIAVEFFAARELDAKRLAQPLDLLVPGRAAAETGVHPPPDTVPQRQPGSVVRK
jgi:hypothetical protein